MINAILPKREAPIDAALELGLLVGLLALYLSTLNQQYQLDALDYATAARDGVSLFHPHHLLYNGFGYLLLRVASLFGRVEPLVVLAATNAVVTCAAVWLCGRLVYTLTGNRRLARGIACGYAISHGIWYMATSVEVYPMAILFELLALNMVAGSDGLAPIRVLLAGCFSALAMCFHQTAIFATPAVMLILNRRRDAMLYATVAFSVTGGIYAAAAWSEGVRTVPALLNWLVMYAHSQQFEMGVWGGGLKGTRMLGGVPGFLGAFVLPAFIWKLRAFSPYRPSPTEIIPILALFAGIVLLIGLFRVARRNAPPPEQIHRRWWRALWLWILIHGLFTLWWESMNFEFWLMIVPPLAIVIGLQMSALPTSVAQVRQRARLGLGLCLVGNLLTTFRPNCAPQENGWRVGLAVLEKNGLRSGDIVLTNEPALASYARYFSKKEIQPMTMGGNGSTSEQVQQFLSRIHDAFVQDRLFLFETDLVDSHPGGISNANVAQSYSPFRRNAARIGTYPAYGAMWSIYHLHPPPADVPASRR